MQIKFCEKLTFYHRYSIACTPHIIDVLVSIFHWTFFTNFIDVILSIFANFTDAIITIYRKKRENCMIVYTPFWKTLKNSSETTYTLINNHHINPTTINRLRNNKPITTTTLNDLCLIFNCDICDLVSFVPEEEK